MSHPDALELRSIEIPKDLNGLDELLEKDPENLQLVDWVAFAHYCCGHYQRAADLYRVCAHLEPGTASYHYFLGNAIRHTGSLAEAIQCWEKAVRLDTVGRFRRKAQEQLALNQA